mmetsp:Transcript_16227/g.50889  ORF Transcript_16227/g.50889 Transcript_16227/m.50889 type:complete len:435 (-) Transcript_16227:30-1334(-)
MEAERGRRGARRGNESEGGTSLSLSRTRRGRGVRANGIASGGRPGERPRRGASYVVEAEDVLELVAGGELVGPGALHGVLALLPGSQDPGLIEEASLLLLLGVAGVPEAGLVLVLDEVLEAGEGVGVSGVLGLEAVGDEVGNVARDAAGLGGALDLVLAAPLEGEGGVLVLGGVGPEGEEEEEEEGEDLEELLELVGRGPGAAVLPVGAGLRGAAHPRVDPEEHVEDVLGRDVVGRAVRRLSPRPVAVVAVPQVVTSSLRRVAQHGERRPDRLERLVRVGRLVLVGVELERQLPVRLLNLLLARLLRHPEHLVVALPLLLQNRRHRRRLLARLGRPPTRLGTARPILAAARPRVPRLLRRERRLRPALQLRHARQGPVRQPHALVAKLYAQRVLPAREESSRALVAPCRLVAIRHVHPLTRFTHRSRTRPAPRR